MCEGLAGCSGAGELEIWGGGGPECPPPNPALVPPAFPRAHPTNQQNSSQIAGAFGEDIFGVNTQV